ncbi:hypothetical protein MTsPCn5_30020 [Croceitalea sp. MTPC5]|nr:hypothetical protein MTsPCn5_30020 [Croceitalea sp. MTPC5]
MLNTSDTTNFTSAIIYLFFDFQLIMKQIYWRTVFMESYL